MAGHAASDIPECPDAHHRAWDWGRYHAELLRRTDTLPPLMRTLQNVRRNRVDWLAPERFPLPVLRLENADDQTVRRLPLAEVPVALDNEHPSVTIETRCGTIAYILRASLIAALVKSRPEQRRTFLGCPLDDAEEPRVAYVSWRTLIGSPDDPALSAKRDGSARPEEAGPHERTIHIPSLWDLMMRSVPFVGGTTNGISAQRDRASHHAAPLGSGRSEQASVQETHAQAPLPPTILIIDALGAPADYDRALIAIARDLVARANFFDRTSLQQKTPANGNGIATIILSTAFHNPHESFAHVFHRGAYADFIFVDAPATQAERRTFMEAWERWRAPHARQRLIKQEATRRLEQLERALLSLGMFAPDAPDSDGTFTFEGRTDVATFDIECVISAIQRDDMPCATAPQLWRGLSERLSSQEIRSARRALTVFLQSRTLLADVPRLDAATFAQAYSLLPDTSIMRLGPVSNTALEFMFTAFADQTSHSLLDLAYRTVVELRNNPLITALILPLSDDNNERAAFQLLNEPLAVAIMAQDAVSDLENARDMLELNGILFTALLIPAPMWAHFMENVFELLDESTLPGLAATLLSNMSAALGVLGEETTDKRTDEVFEQPSDDIIDELINKTNRLYCSHGARQRSRSYIDALTRMSLRHVIHTDGALTWAWVSWVGLLPSWEEIPDVRALLDRIEWLTHLLHEPIPTCDNALKILRALYDLIVEDHGNHLEPDCPCYVHKDVLRRYLLQRFPQRP